MFLERKCELHFFYKSHRFHTFEEIVRAVQAVDNPPITNTIDRDK